MTEDDWAHFVAGGVPRIVRVATIEDHLKRAIGSSTPIVRLEHFYALKFMHRHGISLSLMTMLARTINLGRAVLEDFNPQRKRHLSFFYQEYEGKWYHAAIKTTDQESELWVRTFHRSGEHDVKRISNRGEILRNEIPL